MADAIDLLALDRDIARAVPRLEKATKDLATEDGRALAKHTGDPFAELRHVSTQATFRALEEHETSAHDALHEQALLRWVHELLQARVGWDLAIDEAEAASAIDPNLARRTTAKDGTTLLRTWNEARQALVTSTHEATTRTALERLAELAPPIAATKRERRLRRVEASRRLGLADPEALATSSPGKILPLARAILDATEPLAKALERERAKAGVHALRDVFAEDAREGWPAKLGARWLEDAFGALVRRPFGTPLLPLPVGGASFARAAATFGFSLRLAGTARSLPFALARDPQPDDAHRFGCTFAFAVAGRPFAKRVLGASARGADAHARAMGRSLFFTLRLGALRVLLGTMDVEELTARVFGAPLAAVLEHAWPVARPDETARFVGAIRAHLFARELEDRFDDDWFANPRAGAGLATIAAGPVWQGDVPDEAIVQPLARRWEEALG